MRVGGSGEERERGGNEEEEYPNSMTYQTMLFVARRE
jgi:hypothetical protein